MIWWIGRGWRGGDPCPLGVCRDLLNCVFLGALRARCACENLGALRAKLRVFGCLACEVSPPARCA